MTRRVLGAVLFVVCFNLLALGVLLFIPPWIGLAWVVFLGSLFLWYHLRKDDKWRERRALIRIRPPRASPAWLILACLSTLVALFGVAGMIEVFGRPLRPEDLRGFERLTEYQRSLPGFLALTTLIALVAPIVEEFNFRGRIQHSLERKHGLLHAVIASAVIFSIMHIGVPRSAILLIPLTLGLANGLAVIVFRSIWVPVAIHGLWNGAMAVLSAVNSDGLSAYGEMNHRAVFALASAMLATGVAGWALILRTGWPRLRRVIVRTP